MKKVLYIIGSCLLSYPIFYYFTEELYYHFYHGNSSFGILIAIFILIGQTILIYSAIDYAVERKISSVNIKILWAIYFIVMVFMLFGRRSVGEVINLDISEFFNTYYENVGLMIMNFIAFIPMGYFLERYSWPKAVVFAILIVLCIETMQLISQRGMFDIVDIIINTVAIVFGCFLSKSIYNKKQN